MVYCTGSRIMVYLVPFRFQTGSLAQPADGLGISITSIISHLMINEMIEKNYQFHRIGTISRYQLSRHTLKIPIIKGVYFRLLFDWL